MRWPVLLKALIGRSARARDVPVAAGPTPDGPAAPSLVIVEIEGPLTLVPVVDLPSADFPHAGPLFGADWRSGIRLDAASDPALLLRLAEATRSGFEDANCEFTPLDGGYALFAGERLLIEPHCCCDLGDLGFWETALDHDGRYWTELPGHPCAICRREGTVLLVHGYVEPGDSPVRPAPGGTVYRVPLKALAAAVAQAKQVRLGLAQAMVRAFYGRRMAQPSRRIAAWLLGMDGYDAATQNMLSQIEEDDPELVDLSTLGAPGISSRPDNADRPAWATLVGYGACVEWMDGDRATCSRDTPPVVGERAPVALSRPFRAWLGDDFWCVHTPPTRLANPAERMSKTRLVRVRLVALADGTLRQDPVDKIAKRWADEVEILDVLTLDDLLATPPEAGDLDTILGRSWKSFHHSSHGRVHFTAVDAGGEPFVDVVWVEREGVGHLLVMRVADEQYDVPLDFVLAGHRVLTPGDMAFLTEGARTKTRDR